MAKSSDSVNGKVSDSNGVKAIQYFCTPCQREKKKLPAEGFCKTCNEYLCETCFRYHIRLLVSKNHVMLSKENMPRKEIVPDNEDVLEEICECHDGKIVEFYCKTCDIVGCLICVTSKHENCEIVYIPEYTKELQADDLLEIQNKTNDWNSLKKAREVKDIPSQYKWTIKLYSENARDSIKMYRKEINETIDKLEIKLDREIKAKELEDFAMLDYYSQKLTQQNCQLERQYKGSQQRVYLRGVSSTNVKNKLFISKKLFPYTLEQFEQCQESFKSKVMNRNNNFKVDMELESTLRNVLGRSKKVRQKVKLKNIGRVDVKQKLVTFEEVQDVSRCSISACIAVSDDEFLLNDSENNFILFCRIKESSKQEKPPDNIEERNQDFDIICLKSVTTTPWDMTQMDGKEIAVTLPLKRQIQFLTVGDTDMKLSDSIDVNGQCYGIGYLEKRLYVSFMCPGKVEIMDRNGRVDMTVSSNFPEGVPQFQFSEPKYIACDTERKLVFISDFGNDCIAVTTVDGEMKSVIHYTSLHLDKSLYEKWMRRPLAMTVGKNGTLFVAVHWPFSIQMISSDFQQKEVLRHRGTTWGIQALTLHNNRLYYGTSDGALYVREIINI
ncbi:uncharacterized protein LOC123560322 [Mercenaria mercenaria]|uniref:uncharacterized protein LOC123560322 n=1 Tax=Mercenaria mercenaria TaxID=6596 RepID=UPI00234F0160|nr:uncharacterized protein LOC123560322 [Mercenaria mercenaria]